MSVLSIQNLFFNFLSCATVITCSTINANAPCSNGQICSNQQCVAGKSLSSLPVIQYIVQYHYSQN